MLITGDTSLAENTSINLHLKFQHRRVWSVAGISRRSDVVCSREKETGLIDASWWLPGGGKQANSTRSKVTIPPVECGSCQRGIAFHLILMKNHRVFHNKYSPLTLFAISRSLAAAIDASTHFTLQIRRPATGMIFLRLSFVGKKKEEEERIEWNATKKQFVTRY